MDLAIHALPAGAGNLLSTDRIPYDRDLGGGNWNSEYHTGTEIINAITGLATATFTNINTSINNAITTAVSTVDSNLHILARDTFVSASHSSGVSIFFDSNTDINTFVQANRIYTLKVRIYAYKALGACAVRAQEYNITISTDSALPSPFIQILGGGGSTDFLFDHNNTAGSDIILNPTGFSITSGGKLRCSVSHNIVGEIVTFLGHFQIIL